MKVNILGRGMIPFVGVLAPIRDVELSEAQIRSLMNFKTLRVYDKESGYLISKTTVNDFFNKKIKQPVVKPVVNVEPQKIVTPVVQDEVVESVNEKIVINPKPIDAFASNENSSDESPVDFSDGIAEYHGLVTDEEEVVTEPVDDTTEDDAEKTEEKSEYTFKKKNKKRH